jgi:hypothetical protein
MRELTKTKPRKGSYVLVMPTGEPDPEALRSFMFDCVVPLLAEAFLKRRADTAEAAIQVNSENQTSHSLDKEGGLQRPSR